MPYTKKQQHYIAVFMQQVDIVTALLDTPQPISLDIALDTVNQIVNTASATMSAATTMLSVAGIAATLPSAGLSLPATSAVITALQVGSAGYKFIKQKFYGDDNNPLSADNIETSEKQLSLKILCREVACTAASTRYRHMVEEIASEQGIAEFARYGASRALKKTIPLLDTLPTANEILDYLCSSPNDPKQKMAVLEKYRSGSLLDLDYYAKLAYARPRAVSITFSHHRAQYTFYASKEARGYQSRVWPNTTMAKYGYMVLPEASLPVYLTRQNALSLMQSPELDVIKPHLCTSYFVTRAEVEAYLLEVRASETVFSLNDFLGRHFDLRVIAECHDDRLKGLDLTRGNFSDVNFRQVDLRTCILNNTLWSGAHLDGAFLGGTSTLLQRAFFNAITAEKSHWENVNFAGSDFTEARMNGAHLKSCSLQHMIFINSLWDLAEMENMTLDTSFVTRLNDEEKARLQLELRVSALEEAVANHDQRHQVYAERLDEMCTQLQTLQPQWPLSSFSIPAHIPAPLHAFYAAWRIALENPVLQQTLHYYIELDALPHRFSPDTQRVPLFTSIETFYVNDNSLLLLHGDMGSGKSSAARLCQKRLWEKWRDASDWVPFLIELKQVPRKTKNFLNERLKAAPHGFNDEQIQFLRQNYHFFIIVDGLDECPDASIRKIKEDCALHEWKTKVLLTARTEWLQTQPDYQRTLLQGASSEIFIGFLTSVQSDAYLERRLADTNKPWSEYQNLWRQEKELQELARSPVILHIICEALPVLLTHLTDGKKHTRSWLYNIFLQAWFQREIDKPHPLDNIRELDEVLMQCFFDYMQNLAFRMFCEGTLLIERTYRRNRRTYFRNTSAPDPWAEFFDNKDEQIQQAQRSCPLSLERLEQKGIQYHRYQFIHKSLMEYATANYLWQALHDSENDLGNPLPIWNQRFITEERAILAFLVERLTESPTREREEARLIDMIYASRGKPENAKAASTAITLLNCLKYNFNGRIENKDLSNIHIPYADLTEALLPYVDLSRSDLSYVNFQEAIMIGANLSETNLSNARFLNGDWEDFILEELPIVAMAQHPIDFNLVAYNQHDSIVIFYAASKYISRYLYINEEVRCLAWSKDGKILSASGGKKIFLWNTSSWTIEKVLPGHAMPENNNGNEFHQGEINSLAWSLNGILASGEANTTIYLWDVKKENPLIKILPSRMMLRNGIKYELEHDLRRKAYAAAASQYIHSYNLIYVSKIRPITPIVGLIWGVSDMLYVAGFSTSFFVFNSKEDKLEINDIDNGELYSISFAYAIHGQLFALGCLNGTIFLMNVDPSQKTNIKILLNHNSIVSYLAWSVDEKFLASGDYNGNICIWDTTQAEDKACIIKFTNNEVVSGLAWISQNTLISASVDGSIRYWNIQKSTKDITKKTQVNKKAFDITGTDNIGLRCFQATINEVFATSALESIYIWNSQNTVECNYIKTLEGVSHAPVSSLAFSSQGILASGTLRSFFFLENEHIFHSNICLWDVNRSPEEACIKTLSGLSGKVMNLAWSPNNRFLASNEHNDNSYNREENMVVRLWDIEKTPEEACMRVWSNTNTLALTWNLDGNLLAACDHENVRVWDINQPEGNDCVKILKPGGIFVVFISTNLLALASKESKEPTLSIFDLTLSDANACIKILRGHTSELLGLIFSLEAQCLISYTWNEILFWNPKNLSSPACALPFGVQRLAINGFLLSLIRNRSLHTIDLRNFPYKIQWIKVVPCYLSLEECNFTNAQGLTFYTKIILERRKAIIKNQTINNDSSSLNNNSSSVFSSTISTYREPEELQHRNRKGKCVIS